MYILEMAGSLARPTRIVYQTSTVSPLGGVTLAGFNRHSQGTDWMRVFGKYAIVCMLDGQGQYRDANGLDLPISLGDVILVFPDLAHHYGPRPGATWSEFYVVFEGSVFDAWRAAGLLDPARPVWRLEPTQYWLDRLLAVIESGQPLSLVMRLQQVLADAVEHQHRRTIGQVDLQWLADAQRRLDVAGDHLPLRPQDVAAELGMGYEAFRKKFTRLAGAAPAKYRDGRVIDFAARLLQDRSLPLKQIADRCGFSDEFHFSRRFKQKIGLSPTELRARLR